MPTIKKISLNGVPYDLGGGLTEDVKQASLQIAEKVAYIDEHGQDYYDELYTAFYDNMWNVTNTLSNAVNSNSATKTLKDGTYTAIISAATGYTLEGATVSVTMNGANITSSVYSNGTISIPSVTGDVVITVVAVALTVVSISAVYTQSGDVYPDDNINDLKADLIVIATFNDSSTEVVPSADYTLSGTLTVGTSTVTVDYDGITTTFDVTVSQSPWLYRLLNTNISNNYITPDVTLTDSDKDFTIAFDIDINSLSGTGQYRIIEELETASPYQGLLIGRYGTENYFNFRYYSGYMKSSASYSVPNRIRLVATHSSGVGSMTVKYRIGTGTTIYNDTVSGTRKNINIPITIGGRYENFAWTGVIHSLYLYNRVFSDSETSEYLGV